VVAGHPSGTTQVKCEGQPTPASTPATHEKHQSRSVSTLSTHGTLAVRRLSSVVSKIVDSSGTWADCSRTMISPQGGHKAKRDSRGVSQHEIECSTTRLTFYIATEVITNIKQYDLSCIPMSRSYYYSFGQETSQKTFKQTVQSHSRKTQHKQIKYKKNKIKGRKKIFTSRSASYC